MHKKFEINQTNIKGGCQSGRKVVLHDSKSDLPLLKVQKGGIAILICEQYLKMNNHCLIFNL